MVEKSVTGVPAGNYATSTAGDKTSGFTITNTRNKGSLKIKKTVTVNGNPTESALVDGTYKFTVTGSGIAAGISRAVTITITDGQPVSATINGLEAELESDGTLIIADLPTGNYSVTEDETGLAARGISLAQKPSEPIEVTKNNTANIPTAAFVNNKDIGNLEISKSVVGTQDTTKVFTFDVTLTPTGGVVLESTYPAVKVAERTETKTQVTVSGNKITGIKIAANEKLIINELPANTGYTVEEKEIPAGYEQTSPEGSAKGTIAKDATSEAAFVNTYSATGKITIEGEKVIENRKFTKDDKLTVTITAADGVKLPDPSEVTVALTEGKTAADFSFAEFGYELSDLKGALSKTFVYTVTENATMAGTTPDAKTHTVTVKVTDNTEGKLTVEKTYSDGEKVSFRNTYDATGETTLEGIKAIDGRSFQEGDKWVFTVTAADGTPMPENTSVTIEPTSGTTADIDFGKISYTLADDGKTYSYTVTETGSISGVTNDSVKTVTVKVEDVNTGTLKITNSTEETPLQFTNKYSADGKTTLKGTKVIAGREFKEGDEWTFTVKAEPADAPMPEKTSITIKPTSGTSVDLDFGEIQYELKHAGREYVYTIEEAGNVKFVQNDTSKVVRVRVDDGGDGKLIVKNGSNDSPLVFKNRYDNGNLTVEKILEKASVADPDKAFEFTVTLADTEISGSYGEMTFTDGVATFSLKGGESKTATGLPNGLGYKVTEQTYDGYTLTRHDNTEGTIAGNCEKPETKVAHFYNTYEAAGELPLNAVKKLEGRDLKEAEFKFELKDAEGKVLQSKTNNAQGTVTFDVIRYTLDDMENSPFTYTVNEVVSEDKSVICDKTVKTVTVTLTDNGDGTITAEADKTEEELTFINKVTSINVKKIDVTSQEELEGATIQILDKDGNVVDEWVSTKEAHVTKGLNAGETYTLHETVAPEGYTLAADTDFTVDENGDVIPGTTKMSDEGDLLVEDSRKPKVYLAVTKEWQDDDNRDGLRPLTLAVTLLADGKAVKTVTLNEANHWTASVSGLYGCDDEGKAITYEWREAGLPGYEQVGYKTIEGKAASDGGKTYLTKITNKYGPATTEVNVSKRWVDGDGKARPESIQVVLLADGLAVGQATLNAANGWKASWKDLPVNRNDSGKTGSQKAIAYTVKEVNVPAGYISTVSGSAKAGFVITNTLPVGSLVIEKNFKFTKIDEKPEPVPVNETTQVLVTKTWADGDNADGNRPASITVKLLANGKLVNAATLTAEGNWMHLFAGLPKAENGIGITYTVEEEPVALYETTVEGYHIINTYRPQTTSATVSKVWNDKDNKAGVRPKSIHATLMNGSAVVTTVVLSDENNWTATVNNLPVMVNGEAAVYTWKEQTVRGYQQEKVETVGSTTIFTNKLYERPTPPPGTKGPKTPGTPYLIIEEYGTPLGVEIIINHVGDCFD